MPSSSRRRSSKSHDGGLLFDPIPSHADPEQRSTRKSKEKECGGFDWTPGIAIALLGAMTLLDVQKSVDKREKRLKEEEERERRRSTSSRRRNDRYDDHHHDYDRGSRHSYDRRYDYRDGGSSSRRGSW
ncbi:hypothetical protein HJFPF1_03295 [Paramyrothecium foliicola]|nr:hypothetical protein HJFPF1_03295 [Paramyrothecium foliicola]